MARGLATLPPRAVPGPYVRLELFDAEQAPVMLVALVSVPHVVQGDGRLARVVG
jgi:hypothetical protein